VVDLVIVVDTSWAMLSKRAKQYKLNRHGAFGLFLARCESIWNETLIVVWSAAAQASKGLCARKNGCRMQKR
jgi:hypothetical protein